MKIKVPYVDLGSQWLSIKDRALPKISEVLEYDFCDIVLLD